MIIRNFSHIQHRINGLNLLQLTMRKKYEMIHNIFAIGWIVGILFLVFTLMVAVWVTKATSKISTSNSIIESLWLLLPTFILTSFSIPTLISLYQRDQQDATAPLSLKTLGLQWYWSYEVIDNYQPCMDNSVNRYLDLNNSDRLSYLSSEQELHLPRNVEINNMISASDVMHCWTIPNIMVKVDAIPGRVNCISMLFESSRVPRKMYGQCSELCGVNHRFIPISVIVK